jgi:hypothetical protein
MIKAITTQPHLQNKEFTILENIIIIDDSCLETA